MEHDRNAEAVPILERSLELDPDAIAARRDLGRALLAAGRPEAAIPYLLAAVEQSPRLASLHYELATAFAAVGNAEEAEQHFRLAEELER
jgi:predicted Zn-dependent protease